MSTTRRPGYGSDGADRPFRDDREQKIRAPQAAEALFAPKSPLPAIVDDRRLTRQPVSRGSKPAPVVARPSIETADTTGVAGGDSAPHVARIRSWLKYGMTIADLDQQLVELRSAADAYAARHQFIPDLTWPQGVRIAVNFTCDFDAMLLRRLLNEPPMQLAKGEFGGRVGIWRLIEQVARHCIDRYPPRAPSE